VANAKQFGTPSDQLCAQTLADNWGKLEALLADDSGALIAFSYRAVVASRLTQAAKDSTIKDCGSLAAELMVQFGKTAMKFRP
jgi:hypothetical protein